MSLNWLITGPLRFPGLAFVGGLFLGALFTLVSSGESAHRLIDDWEPFPDITRAGVESRVEQLSSSSQWGKKAAMEATDAAQKIPGRPGAFAYLQLVAIENEPEAGALFYVENFSDSLADQLLLSPDSRGLFWLVEGEAIAEGWQLITIGDSDVTFVSETDGEVVKFRLFEWLNERKIANKKGRRAAPRRDTRPPPPPRSSPAKSGFGDKSRRVPALRERG